MNRLKELRTEKGLTLREVADAIGKDYSTVGQIERGRRGLSMDSLKRACDYFDVSADYMLMRTDSRSENTEVEEVDTGSGQDWSNRLRELRKAKGLTTEELGRRLELDASMVTHIESGDRQFSIDSSKRACEFFGVTPNEMLGVTELPALRELEITAVTSKENKYIRTTKPHGYLEVYMPESPMARKDGWVLMHRLIVSLSIRRPLTDEEVVHHINGDPSDNRLSNLELFANNVEHLKWHAVQRRDEIIKSLLEQ